MAIESATVSKLLEIAVAQTGIAKTELVAREIMPKTDLELTNEEWTHTYVAAYTYEELVNVALPKNKFIAFFGYTNESPVPKTLGARFGTPAKKVDEWQTQKVNTYGNPTGFAKEPVIFIGGKTMVVELYGNAVGEDRPVLKGPVVEPIGELISPSAGRK